MSLPRIFPRLAFTPPQSTTRADTLVVIFLRGAADGLNMVVPHGEAAYYALRPSLGIARPDDLRVRAKERAIDLDGFFGLHPGMQPLLESWNAGSLAFIHACGAPDESRSHFKAMELMERGVQDERGPASGWIGRHLAATHPANPSPLRVVGMGVMPQRSLSGSVPVSALRSIADFHLGGDARAAEQMRAMLEAVYAGESSGQETLRMLDRLQQLAPLSSPSGGGYPDSEFGRALSQTAALIRAEVGLEAAAIDLGGWDTHFAQGGSTGLQANLIRDLAQGLTAFHAEMRNHLDRLTVVCMSEFGRRAAENGSLGTDHGHGSMLMVMGGHVRGGQVHGTWPGLADSQLVGPGDLAVTTDYRDVLSEILRKRMGSTSLQDVFPSYTPVERGILKD